MNNIALLHEMFTLQQKLNDETNGLEWEKGYNKHGRIINWKRCIYMEAAELIDSFNWKHWKDINIDPDWDNVIIELVDIWHFVMSLGLEEYKCNKIGDIDILVEHVYDSRYFDEFCNDVEVPDNSDAMTIINTIEHILIDTLQNQEFYKILDDFMIISLQCGLNFDVLYKFYVGKNILNKFRQDNGYKEGTYQKVWNGVEDNVVMTEMLEKDALGPDALYTALDKAYKAL
ncbi:MAG: dUTP diphosphatase [Epsilonproteobacteria bacterium]|nr:dUTP diphosphatase [Campylobacterota bacterium]